LRHIHAAALPRRYAGKAGIARSVPAQNITIYKGKLKWDCAIAAQ
jgi:hypothetical protein